MGTPTVVGVIPGETVRRDARPFAGAFRRCYLDRVATEPVQISQPRVVITVGPDGQALTARFVERRGTPDDVAWCVAQRFCRTRFYAPEMQEATIEVPFTVTPMTN